MTDDGFFDKDIAASYDRVHDRGDANAQMTAKTLSQLAFDKRALEFAIGTGRIALPLQKLGLQVKGIELSKAMTAQLKAKDGGSEIEVTIGDMATTRLNETFSLVYLIYNTIDNLTSQEAQIACFENASAHLKSGGRFVIETLVPPLQKLPFGETKLAFDLSSDHWGIDDFDVLTQKFTSNHIHFKDGSYTHFALPLRYAWPSELDLMARIAGLKLEHRWAGWDKSDFTKTSKSHVSVWKKPDA